MSGSDPLAFLSVEARAAIEALVDEAVERKLAEREAEREEPEFATIPEAAEIIRSDRQRVDDLLSSGRLTRVKEGSRTLIRRAEIYAYLDGRKR